MKKPREFNLITNSYGELVMTCVRRGSHTKPNEKIHVIEKSAYDEEKRKATECQSVLNLELTDKLAKALYLLKEVNLLAKAYGKQGMDMLAHTGLRREIDKALDTDK